LARKASEQIVDIRATRVTFRPKAEARRITRFVKRVVRCSGAEGVVLGVSGGIDSAVVATLCQRALGQEYVLGLQIFEDEQKESQDYLDAKRIVGELKIPSFEIDLSPVLRAFSNNMKSRNLKLSRLTLANIKARLRMTILYSLANERNLLVVGTDDRSESLLGYFTKYGDGGSDLMPIVHLYKSEVRALGAALRLPFEIIIKPSSPNLWRGQLATHELPADYDVLDPILTLLFDSQESLVKVAEKTKTSLAIIRKVVMMNKKTQHKRELPISLELS
jgi:NAD+ synthase